MSDRPDLHEHADIEPINADRECGTVSAQPAVTLDTKVDAGSTPIVSDNFVDAPEPSFQRDSTMSDPSQDNIAEQPAATEARLDAVLEKMDALIQAMSAREALKPVPAPQAAIETDAARLSRENDELRAKMARTMSAAGRVGVSAAIQRRVDTATGFKRMVQRAAGDLPNTSAVLMVCENQAERRDATNKMTPDRQTLEQDLRAMLAAAHADNIITDSEGSWT